MQTLLRRTVGGFNRWIMALRGHPRFGTPLRRRLTVITYTGRRSGRTFTTPVAFRRTGDVVTIDVAMPGKKTWWRNFLGDGASLSLELDDTTRTGHATTTRDAKGRVRVTVQLS